MTRIIHLNYCELPAGADRGESGLEAAQQFSSTRGIALLLMSAMAAAVVTVAYEVMDTTAEGHLMLMWMGLWAALFAALVALASGALRLKSRLDNWSQRRAQARADRRLWAMAQKDERVMADLQMTLLRGQRQAEDHAAKAVTAQQAARAARALQSGTPGLHGYHRYPV